MIELLIGAAFAQATGPVDTIVWARPFTLAIPDRDPNGPPEALGAWGNPTLTRGWLVELRADPALLRPSNYAEPYLYVGTARAMKLNWDTEGGCLVAIVSGQPDLAATPFLLGAPARPGEDLAAVAQREAQRLGVTPLPAEVVSRAIAAGGAPLAARDLREVYAHGMDRVRACSRTPTDQTRGAP